MQYLQQRWLLGGWLRSLVPGPLLAPSLRRRAAERRGLAGAAHHLQGLPGRGVHEGMHEPLEQ